MRFSQLIRNNGTFKSKYHLKFAPLLHIAKQINSIAINKMCSTVKEN